MTVSTFTQRNNSNGADLVSRAADRVALLVKGSKQQNEQTIHDPLSLPFGTINAAWRCGFTKEVFMTAKIVNDKLFLTTKDGKQFIHSIVLGKKNGKDVLETVDNQGRVRMWLKEVVLQEGKDEPVSIRWCDPKTNKVYKWANQKYFVYSEQNDLQRHCPRHRARSAGRSVGSNNSQRSQSPRFNAFVKSTSFQHGTFNTPKPIASSRFARF